MEDIVPRYFIEKEFEKLKVNALVYQVEDGNYSFDSCLKAIRALSTLSAIALQQSNNALLVDFLDEGACEMLILALNKYILQSVKLCSYGLQCICNMCFCSKELNEFLGEIGACEIVVYILSVHIGDGEISEYGSCAMYLLANNNIANSLKLAEANACEILSQVGNFGFNIQNDRSSVISSYVCLTFTLLCEAGNATILLECGADELIVSLLKIHKNNRSVLLCGMKALCNLASLNQEHQEMLGKLGTCYLIAEMITKSDNITFIKDCCEAIMHLSVNPVNCKALHQMNAVGIILHCLDKKLIQVDYGTEICSGAIFNLITVDSEYSQLNIHRLRRYNAIDMLQRSLYCGKSSLRARDNITYIIHAIETQSMSGGDSFDPVSNPTSPVIQLSKSLQSQQRPSLTSGNTATAFSLAVAAASSGTGGGGGGTVLQSHNSQHSLLQPETREYIEFRKLASPHDGEGEEEDVDDENSDRDSEHHKLQYKSKFDGVYEI